MFTGIIESIGTVKEIQKKGTNSDIKIEVNWANELEVDKSVSHNGVCLTVTAVENNAFWVTAVEETLKKSNLGLLELGHEVNLERSMLSNYRFDGHIVQGHVDQTGTCTKVQEMEGSWLYDFEYDPSVGNFLVEKGSICINGVSLTVFNTQQSGRFTVTIIPHTYQVTNFKNLKEGSVVNLEFDVIGKYIQRLFENGYADYLKSKINK